MLAVGRLLARVVVVSVVLSEVIYLLLLQGLLVDGFFGRVLHVYDFVYGKSLGRLGILGFDCLPANVCQALLRTR